MFQISGIFLSYLCAIIIHVCLKNSKKLEHFNSKEHNNFIFFNYSWKQIKSFANLGAIETVANMVNLFLLLLKLKKNKKIKKMTLLSCLKKLNKVIFEIGFPENPRMDYTWYQKLRWTFQRNMLYFSCF